MPPRAATGDPPLLGRAGIRCPGDPEAAGLMGHGNGRLGDGIRWCAAPIPAALLTGSRGGLLARLVEALLLASTVLLLAAKTEVELCTLGEVEVRLVREPSPGELDSLGSEETSALSPSDPSSAVPCSSFDLSSDTCGGFNAPSNFDVAGVFSLPSVEFSAPNPGPEPRFAMSSPLSLVCDATD